MSEEKSVGFCSFRYDAAEFSLVTQILVSSDKIVKLKEHFFFKQILWDDAVYLKIGGLGRLFKCEVLVCDQNENRLFG